MRTEKIQKAIEFATIRHGSQVRKYSGEPYTVHLEGVAEIVSSVTTDEDVIVAAWLHDVLEDTETTISELRTEFGAYVAWLVYSVTDRSKKEDGNRELRKKIDLDHLSGAGPEAQTIKLADLIHNTSSIVDNDPKFARVYLKEKEALLCVLRKGNETLITRALSTLNQGLRKLSAV